MGDNFLDKVKYGRSTLAVDGDAIKVGSGGDTKSIIFSNSQAAGHLVWNPTANRTISLPDSGGMLLASSQGILSISAGTTRVTSGEIVFSNSNGISFGVNGNTITAIYTVPSTAGLISAINVSAGTTSNNLSAITFANANNVTFGLDASTITASVPTQSNQTIGGYAVGNTTGQSSSSTFDARTISFDGAGAVSVGYSNSSIVISAPTQTVQTQNVVVPSAGTQTATSGTVIFSNSNGISFGMSNSSVITASYTVPTQTNQTVGLFALGNTTQNSSTTLDARSLSFNGLGIITVGYSNGSIQLSATTAQSNQTVGLYALGNTTQNSSTTLDARTLSFNGLGGATVGYSNGSIQISAPTTVGLISAINVSAGTTSNNLTAITFSNSNGISFGLNASTITASYTVPTQTNQTVGLYAVGNTTQNSSTTLDARTLSFDGLGIVTVGYSNGSIQISATQSAQTQNLIQAIYDGANSITTGTVRVSNSNGVSFGINGQTLTASIAPRKVFQLGPDSPWQTNFFISNASFSLQHFTPKADITATQANLLMALSGNTNSTGALTISLGVYTMLGSTMSLASSTSRQITWTSGSDTTNSTVYGGISGTCYRTVSLGNWSFSAGDYMLGVWCRTTNNGSWRIFGTQGPTIVNAQDVNETQMYLPGYFSTGSFTTAMVGSINVTDTNYVRTGIPVLQQPSIMFAGTV